MQSVIPDLVSEERAESVGNPGLDAGGNQNRSREMSKLSLHGFLKTHPRN
jgi:hypothetical protein